MAAEHAVTWATGRLAQAEAALAYAEDVPMCRDACNCSRCSDVRRRREWWFDEVQRLKGRP